MYFFREFNVPTNKSKQELQEIFKSELVGVHQTVEDGFFSKSNETYDLTNDYDRFLLQMRNESKSNMITVFSVIKLESSDDGTSKIAVSTKFTSLTKLIILFAHLLFTPLVLMAPNMHIGRGLHRIDISNNYPIRVLLLCSALLIINLLLWWRHRVSSKEQERVLKEILLDKKLL